MRLFGDMSRCNERIGSLSTDVRVRRTATASRMFLFLARFCSLPRTEKALFDNCGLMLQTQWRENAPKREKSIFRQPYVAQKRVCLSSLITHATLIQEMSSENTSRFQPGGVPHRPQRVLGKNM